MTSLAFDSDTLSVTDKDPHVIGARIARRRHQLGWSQVELAEQLGVSPSSVANWERGAAYPKKKIGKVEQVLGISLDGLDAEPADRSPPARLSEEAREALRRDIGDPVLAEQAIIYAEGLANGQIPGASSYRGDDRPGSGTARRRARG